MLLQTIQRRRTPKNFVAVEIRQDLNEQNGASGNGHKEFAFADENVSPVFEDAGGNEFSGEVKEFDFYNEDLEAAVIENEAEEIEVESFEDDKEPSSELKLADKLKLQQEN